MKFPAMIGSGLLGFGLALAGAAERVDVVVYGATPAGVAAAVNAAREGATVVLVQEDGHLGGLASGGLSNTDLRTFESQGGTFREFMHRVERYYIREFGADSQPVKDCVKGAYYEPKVARRVFEEMLGEQTRARVLLHHRLAKATVETTPGRPRITAATFTDLKQNQPVEFAAKVFIDATYEGDLLAAAGVPYHLGCESKAQYGESLAFDEENKWVQTYNFRVTLTQDPANRLPLPKPANYRRDDYVLLLDYLKDGRIQSFSNPQPKAILKVRPMANQKADFNDDANCPVSLSLKNVNHAWPEGSPEVRARIFQRYRDYSQGLFWFLANDPEIPESIRSEMRRWGLPKDEFTDTGHWTPALYVREGRRMIGEYIFTEHDTQPAADSVRAPLNPDSVAIGDYSLNCHGVYSPAPGGNVGRIGRSIRPFQIPYAVMLPKELEGLLVPVAVSSSHVGFCAIRMEPSWVALGQAAGVAAAQAIRQRLEVRQVKVPELQARLHELGAITVYISDLGQPQQIPRPAWDPPGFFSAHVLEVPPASPHFKAAQYFGTRGFFHDLVDAPTAKVLKQPLATGQWREKFPHHALEPDRPMDAALAAKWREKAGVKPGRGFEADGQLTRGEFLNRLYAAIRRDGRE